MYTKFFDLKEKPFNLTPSPRFLYLGETHREALAMLTYGVMEKKGFVLLTGEVGTGKTTIVQTLMQNLEGSAECFYLSNPILTPSEFYDYLGSSLLKKRVHYDSKADFLLDFEELFRRCRERKKNLLLIIDDAQKLSRDLLEELRLLSNLETSEEKFINIFLVGQPELNERLNEPPCQPLLQRIGLRHHISPLDLKDTQAYLETRLKIAGAGEKPGIFTKGAVQAIFEHSRGTPRMINILADNAMLLAYSKGKKKITREMIEECQRDLSAHETPAEQGGIKPLAQASRSSARRWAWAGVLALVLAAGLWFLASSDVIQIPMFNRPGPQSEQTPTQGPPDDGTRVTRSIRKAEESSQPSAGSGDTTPEIQKSPEIPQTPDTTSVAATATSSPLAKPSNEPGKPLSTVPDLAGEPTTPPLPEDTSEKAEAEPSSAATPTKKASEAQGGVPVLPEQSATPPLSADRSPTAEHAPSPPVVSQGPHTNEAREAQTAILKTLKLEAGQDVWRAALELYGVVDKTLLQRLRQANPQLRDEAPLAEGREIAFPVPPQQNEPAYTVHLASYKPFRYARAFFSELVAQGMDPLITEASVTPKGRVYRVSIGRFPTLQDAGSYAATILREGTFPYAQPITLPSRRQKKG